MEGTCSAAYGNANARLIQSLPLPRGGTPLVSLQMKRSSAISRSNQFAPGQLEQRHLTGELAFQIDNLTHIAAAYGELAAITAERIVHHFAMDLVGTFGTVTRSASGRFHVTVARLPKQVIYMFLHTATRHPVRTVDQVFHVVISVNCADCWAGHAIAIETFRRGRRFGGVPCADDTQWVKGYRRDMAVAVRLFKAIDDRHFEFHRQPVRYANSCDIILYHELVAKPAGYTDVGQFRHATHSLKRLGLLPALEEHFVQHAIDQVTKEPKLRLGVNISLESAVLDAWWFNICEKLGSSPDIAERLVFEVSEVVASSRHAIHFMTEIKRYGCQVALDDVGLENPPVWVAGTFSPDIAKIDASLVQLARASDWAHHKLISLIDQAALASGVVIVQGIRTQKDCEAASNLGCCWQQGTHFETPGCMASADPPQTVDVNNPLHPLGRSMQDVGSFAGRLHWPHSTVMVTVTMWASIVVALFVLVLRHP